VTADHRHRVVALALPEVVAFDLSIAAQVFGHRDERDRYTFTVCAEHPGPVPTTTGFPLTAPAGLDALASADTIIIPGYYPLAEPAPAALAALRAAAARGTRIATICIGAFALAATGLLDGRTATTHWQEADHFRARFPAVRLNPDVLYVDEGQFLTSAGLSAGIDLCLYLVSRDYGAATAATVARGPGSVRPAAAAGRWGSRTHAELGRGGAAPAADRGRPGPARGPAHPHLRPPVP
jgi:transcriptional regulator GlxA family with amidase domain